MKNSEFTLSLKEFMLVEMNANLCSVYAGLRRIILDDLILIYVIRDRVYAVFMQFM